MTRPVVWFDLETTGLDPQRCHIIEYGALVTAADDLYPLGGADNWTRGYVKIPSRALAALQRGVDAADAGVDKAAAEMHQHSGLVDDYMTAVEHDPDQVAASPEEAGRRIVDWLIGLGVPAGEAWLGGSGVHFDRRLIDERMPSLAGFLHYRLLDVSVLRRAARMWADVDVMGNDGEPRHRAFDDAVSAVRQAQRTRDLMLAAAAARPPGKPPRPGPADHDQVG